MSAQTQALIKVVAGIGIAAIIGDTFPDLGFLYTAAIVIGIFTIVALINTGDALKANGNGS